MSQLGFDDCLVASSPGTLSIPPSTSNLSEAVAMSTNPMIQLLEDRFLHWHRDMEKKDEEAVRPCRTLAVRE